jgi:riboflavin biosynthesis pyrimidine reductase
VKLYGAAGLRVNFVTSLDGATEVQGFSKGLSNPADKRVFELLRMLCDALLVGAGTLRHEGYGAVRLDERRRAWRRAHGLAEYPTLVVVSGRLALSPSNPALAAAPVRPVILTHLAAPADRRAALEPVADVLAVGDTAVDLPAGSGALRARGLHHVLCEGGPHLLGALSAADLVDELSLTISPLLTGPGAGRITAGPPLVDNVRRMRLRHVLLADDVLILRYERAGSQT